MIATAKKFLTETSSGGAEETYSMFQFGAHIQTRADLAGAEVVTALKQLAKKHNSMDLEAASGRACGIGKVASRDGQDPCRAACDLR